MPYISGSLDDLYELDIKLNREEAAIFKSGGDPSSATGAFTFKGDKPTHEELMAIKRLIEEHGIESWDPATRYDVYQLSSTYMYRSRDKNKAEGDKELLCWQYRNWNRQLVWSTSSICPSQILREEC